MFAQCLSQSIRPDMNSVSEMFVGMRDGKEGNRDFSEL
jgi:hypothetical protein